MNTCKNRDLLCVFFPFILWILRFVTLREFQAFLFIFGIWGLDLFQSQEISFLNRLSVGGIDSNPNFKLFLATMDWCKTDSCMLVLVCVIGTLREFQAFSKVPSSYGLLAYFSDIFISGKNVVFLHTKVNIFATNESIGKICKRTITWTDLKKNFKNLGFLPNKYKLVLHDNV